MEATLSASGDHKSVYSDPRHTPVRANSFLGGLVFKLLLKCTVIEISLDSIINEEEYLIACIHFELISG